MSNYNDLSALPSVPAPAEIVLTPADTLPSAAFYRRQFFFGPFGLRAVWSLLIYFAILGSIIMGVRTAAIHKAKHDKAVAAASAAKNPPATSKLAEKTKEAEPQPMGKMIMAESIVFVVLFLISLLMAKIEHRKVSAFGLGGSRPISRLLIGGVWGLAAQSALIAILYFDHLLVFDARLDHGIAILGWGVTQLLAFLLVGFVEEYMFRGYIQFTLTRGLVSIGNLFSPKHARSIAFWIAGVITSAIFFFAHTGNPGENKIGLFQVFLAGILLLVCLWRTGSLWLAIGFHMAWDWAQSFLFGVPDSGGLEQGRLFATHALGNPHLSGGTDGPEGSIFGIPILIVAIALLFLVKPSPQPPLETKSDPLPEDLRITEAVLFVDPPTSAT